MSDKKPHVSISMNLYVKDLDSPGIKQESWNIGKKEPRSMAQLLASATRTIIGMHYFLTVEELKDEFELFKRFVAASEIEVENNER